MDADAVASLEAYGAETGCELAAGFEGAAGGDVVGGVLGGDVDLAKGLGWLFRNGLDGRVGSLRDRPSCRTSCRRSDISEEIGSQHSVIRSIFIYSPSQTYPAQNVLRRHLMVLFCKKRHILSSPLIRLTKPENNDAKAVSRRDGVEEVQLKSREDGLVSQPKNVAFLSQDRLSSTRDLKVSDVTG